MKIALVALFTLFVATLASAAESTCSYTLDNDWYWEDASGDLVLNGKAYRCETLMIGEDQKTLCKDKSDLQKRDYDLVMGFDGAEADFGVYRTLDFNNNEVCSGQAVTK